MANVALITSNRGMTNPCLLGRPLLVDRHRDKSVWIARTFNYLTIYLTILATVKLLISVTPVNIVDPVLDHGHTETLWILLATYSTVHLDLIFHTLRDAILHETGHIRKVDTL
jgi:hypothetical protein